MGDTEQSISKTMAIAQAAELGDEAMALLRPGLEPLEYLELLQQKDLFLDAIRFLAHALPKREAVWWAWVSTRRTAGENPPPKIKAALDATEKWIATPNEENRRATKPAADQARFTTAAGCTALAAFFSGGSLTPPEGPVVPPGEFLTAKAAAGAILYAAINPEPRRAPENFRSFIAQGIDVARRIRLWETKR